MTRPERHHGGGGLSLTTLLLASLSSALAALVVSRFWENGTVISAAVTPVLVTLLSEALRRPTERLGEVARPLAKAARPRSRQRRDAADDAPRFGDEGPPPRVFGGRRLRLQAVAITAVLAFVIAAAALTLPELLLGRSVGSGEARTTYFGGQAAPRSEEDGDQNPADEGEQQTTSTTTTETTPETETETAPTDTGTTPTDPAQPPEAPAPTEPAPQGGQPAPPASNTPK